MPDYTFTGSLNTELLKEEFIAAGYDFPFSASENASITVHVPGGNPTTEADLQVVVTAHDNGLQSTTEIIETAQTELLDKAALATTFADDIKTLFNAVWDESQNSTTQNSRFEDLATTLDGLAGALKNRFHNDLIQEAGIDFIGLGGDLATRLAAATAQQRRTYCLYLRVWSQGLAFLLIINKVV